MYPLIPDSNNNFGDEWTGLVVLPTRTNLNL